jgi:hypothetical protein
MKLLKMDGQTLRSDPPQTPLSVSRLDGPQTALTIQKFPHTWHTAYLAYQVYIYSNMYKYVDVYLVCLL